MTKKKHVTMDDRPSSRSSTPKMTASSTVTDIRNRYFNSFSLSIDPRQEFNDVKSPSLLTQNKSRPPAPLPYRPSSAGPPIHRHSSLRQLSMSQSHVPDLLASKKRFTPPPSMSKSMVNKSSISSLNYGNQFRQNNSSQTISDKVIFPNFYLSILSALINTTR